MAPSTVTAAVVVAVERSTLKPSSTVAVATAAGNVTPSAVCGWIIVVSSRQRVQRPAMGS